MCLHINVTISEEQTEQISSSRKQQKKLFSHRQSNFSFNRN